MRAPADAKFVARGRILERMRLPIPVRSLRRRLEECRRRNLGLVKALDRVGVLLQQLPAEAMQALGECDGDCALGLAGLAALSPRAAPLAEAVDDVARLEAQQRQVEEAIAASVPPRHRQRLRDAHEVGMLVVEDEEIYEGIPRPRRR
jgi:hypothetical protein